MWCLAIVAAPLGHWESVYSFFSAICHQLPERSWNLAGSPLAVCIRCTSIYLGFLLGTLSLARANLKMLMLALSATLVEFTLAHFILDSAWLRAGSGLALGMTAAPFVVLGVEEMIEERFRRWNGVARDSV